MIKFVGTESTVISTFSATGWFARIKLADDEIYEAPLICWAIMQCGEVQEIVGLMATDEVVIADKQEGFMCYIDQAEIKQQVELRSKNQ